MIFQAFSELINLYFEYSPRDTVLFNNKEILIGGKPFFKKEWLDDNDNGRFLSLSDFQVKYILLLKSRSLESSVLNNFNNPSSFPSLSS